MYSRTWRASRLSKPFSHPHKPTSSRPRSQPFSDSPIHHAQIPPESPRFIEIPRTVQPDAVRPRFVKGVLPMPRKIMSQDPRHQRKVTPEYLASVTPEPASIGSDAATAAATAEAAAAGGEGAGVGERGGLETVAEPSRLPQSDRTDYKARQASHRRRNLREGLLELQQRDVRNTRNTAARRAQRLAANVALRDAGEREDERLTRPSVLSSSMPSHHHHSHHTHSLQQQQQGRSSSSARLLEAKRANVALARELEREEKKTLLQDLYVTAGDFITTEAQLEQSLNKAFDSRAQFRSERGPGMNVWNLGVPESTRALSGKDERALAKESAVEQAGRNDRVTRERVKRIAEVLTGGKI